jgi:hypothetical protein
MAARTDAAILAWSASSSVSAAKQTFASGDKRARSDRRQVRCNQRSPTGQKRAVTRTICPILKAAMVPR